MERVTDYFKWWGMMVIIGANSPYAGRPFGAFSVPAHIYVQQPCIVVREPATFLGTHFGTSNELHGSISIFSTIQNIFVLCVSAGAFSVSALPKHSRTRK